MTVLQVNIPAPVGMICVGLFLSNVAGAVLISGLKASWSKEIRAAALAIIFLRSGLELDLRVRVGSLAGGCQPDAHCAHITSPHTSPVLRARGICRRSAPKMATYYIPTSRCELTQCLHLQVFKKIGWPAVKLLLIPGLVEAFFNGGMAVALFDMTALFGFALGFILKAIGPALVIQLMFELQQKRLGTEKSALC